MPAPFQRYATIIRNGQNSKSFKDLPFDTIASAILSLSSDTDATGKVLNALPGFIKDQLGRVSVESLEVRVLTTRLQLQNPPDIQYISAVGNKVYAVDGEWIRISNTSGGGLTLTSAPTIPDGANGQRVTILNISAQNVVLSDQGTLASSNLRLGAATRTLGPRDSIQLRYSTDIGDWVEEFFSNVI